VQQQPQLPTTETLLLLHLLCYLLLQQGTCTGQQHLQQLLGV
jgi:hypothetical protein